ncbi:NUDIX hydrolase [Polycladospora coralii]|uniref:NUDIX hydrolase n=1 Tax=Polycladospora coralii TaxID=2771432 RepID=UPI0020C07046|nr:NUDIX hydrolase [Polycladospora coralii]
MVVGAVIRIDNRFLLLERVDTDFVAGLVELPSGTVDTGESLFSALEREVREETGLMLEAIDQYLVSFDYVSGSNKNTRQFNFLIKTLAGDIRLEPTEHQAYHLIETSSKVFHTYNISEETIKVLNTALQHISLNSDY